MKKYKVTQEFMDALEEWNDSYKDPDGITLINQYTLNELPEDVTEWLFEIRKIASEKNKRLGALINWINGENVFDIKSPKYIVRLREMKYSAGSEYLYLTSNESVRTISSKEKATRFDAIEQALEWTNAHFDVVEVDE